MNLQQQISSFISQQVSLNILPEPSIKVDQPVVFFHSKDEPVPAIVREVQKSHNGLWANLTIYLPDYARKVEGIGGGNIQIVNDYYLKEERRARVFLTYPEITFGKEEIKLDKSIEREGMVQTHSDIWYPADIASQPRLSGIQTNQVGKFFDPQFYKFWLYCYKGEFEDLRHNKVEAEEARFPLASTFMKLNGEGGGIMDLIRRPKQLGVQVQATDAYYDTFELCYREFFIQKYKEVHPEIPTTGRWDRVEIRAEYKGKGLVHEEVQQVRLMPDSGSNILNSGTGLVG